MNLETLGNIISIASQDKENNIEVLKTELKNNGFKLCSDSAKIMIGEMQDLGMNKEQAMYWEALALTNLPQHPSQVL